MNKLLSFAVLAALLAMAAADCQVSVTQTLGSAWTTNGQDFSQWSVTLTNTGSDGVKSVDLSISNDSLFDQLWNIVKDNRGLYVLPDYVLENGGIAVSGSYQFGYIIKSKTRATIDLEAVDCKALSPSVAPSTSPAAPSASASPAAASPSSSASPVVVASPQPTGCTVSVESVARSAASGGQWTEGDSQFQIFDVTITNSGNTPVTSVTLTISGVSGADVSIYQFWNLERKDNSDVFTVPTPWGAIQVGASQGAGFIVKSKEGQSAATPVVKVESATCSGSPTAAPSAAPGSPSPSPSPSSPVVATPQPSAAPAGCSAELTIVARSAASGGQWQDGNKWNQIFDVVVTNTGSKALTGGQVSFALASGVSVSQFWELNRKDATTFTIPTTYGPIQVGASQGAGIVATTTTATSIATPTATLSGLTCN